MRWNQSSARPSLSPTPELLQLEPRHSVGQTSAKISSAFPVVVFHLALAGLWNTCSQNPIAMIRILLCHLSSTLATRSYNTIHNRRFPSLDRCNRRLQHSRQLGCRARAASKDVTTSSRFGNASIIRRRVKRNIDLIISRRRRQAIRVDEIVRVARCVPA